MSFRYYFPIFMGILFSLVTLTAGISLIYGFYFNKNFQIGLILCILPFVALPYIMGNGIGNLIIGNHKIES